MISNPCIEVQTTAENRFSVPAWFAEVVIIARYLEKQGLLEAFVQQVRLVRGRFGSYEPIDFLALLIGYAISGERTLADFFERVEPFETAFMALFGRRCLPHRSSLSRFLADVDRPCARSLPHARASSRPSAKVGPRKPLAASSRRLGRRYLVFDVDATRQAARQRALPCDTRLACCQTPPGRRSVLLATEDASAGRWCARAPQRAEMHTRQWVGTYAGKGNGDYRGELASALRAITAYLK